MESHVSQICWALLYLLAAYRLLILPVYRRTLHPLAKYPGPWLSSITSWHQFYETTTGTRHLSLARDHAQYGPIVRVAPNLVSINTVSALKAIYGNRKANVQKSDWYRNPDAPSGAFSTHTEIDHEKHAFRRRVLENAFSPSALKEAESFVLKNIKTWCQYIAAPEDSGAEWSEPRNMSDWTTYLTYDILGDLAYGKSFHCIEDDENRWVPPALMAGSVFLYSWGYLPFHNLLRPIISPPIIDYIGPFLSPEVVAEVEYANKQIDDRVKAESDPAIPTRKDFVHYLLHARDPATGKGFTRQELDADSSLMIAAGTDTTGAALSAAIFYLVQHPGVQAKVTKEVRDTFTNYEDIHSGSTLNSLTYLRAVIDETLRFSPPALGILPREVISPGLEIDGNFYPPGTVVGTSSYCLHRNEDYFPEPYTFAPERWIIDEEASPDSLSHEATVARAKEAFSSFSLGTRGCAGKNLAYLEMMLSLASFLWLFDIREADDTTSRQAMAKWFGHGRRMDEYPMRDRFLPERYGPFVQLRRRT